MRIKSLTISWFRGAAEPVTLETGENSVVVYGPNGAGKSSFVDALEYLLSQGKVAHLANEYSGRRLENAVINTQIPKSMETEARLNLTNGSIVSAKIGKSNSPTFSGSSSIEGWRKDRIVLRQEEVCAFVQADKGEKYSSILPLIGLGPIELIAINLRALSKRVQTEASVLRDRGALAELEKKWVQAKISTYEAGVLVKALHVKYRRDVECPETLDQTVAELLPIVNGRVQNTSSETRQFLQLTNVLNASIDEKLLTFLCKNNKASALSEPLLNERLSILTATSDFVAKLSRQEASVVCPSCGQEVQLDNFSAHVNTETLRLKQAIEAFSNRDRAYNILLDGIQAVANAFRSADLQKWTAAPDQCSIRNAVNWLLDLNVPTLREKSGNLAVDPAMGYIRSITVHIRHATLTTPPEASELLTALKLLDAVSSHPRMRELRSSLRKVDQLVNHLDELERQTRKEIHSQTEAVITGISHHIRSLWNHLHPGSQIQDIALYQPSDTTKAIDLSVSFYGKPQPSPRLSLSEGDRHSLGLCVFLSLAKNGHLELPLVLDDVVNSLDREHRSNVADLLITEFPGRQILLFTHEYEWFIELRSRLPGEHWRFLTLLPFDSPATGIRWSGAPHGFANSRVLLAVDPKSAANSARGLMDLHMAQIAERLALPVPFLRGARNDLRHAGELLDRFSSRARTQLKRKVADGQYEAWNEPTTAAASLQAFLLPWGNAGSHGRYLTYSEAERLIEACEHFVSSLICTNCKTHISYAVVSGKHMRCDCDSIRWKL